MLSIFNIPHDSIANINKVERIYVLFSSIGFALCLTFAYVINSLILELAPVTTLLLLVLVSPMVDYNQYLKGKRTYVKKYL